MAIKYLAHFDVPTSNRNRAVSLATVNKLDYIFKTLSDLGIEVDIISASNVEGKESQIGFKEEIYPGIELNLLPTLKRPNIFLHIIAAIVFRIRLIISLFKNVKNGDTLFVYHSLLLVNYVKILKFFKKINLILEVEEIYGDVKENKRVVKKELNFFKKADGYLFVSELLEQKLNTEKKPYAIIYGTYCFEETLTEKFDDGKIHCVYAGTFAKKKGVENAIKVASELTSNYVIHIMGAGITEELYELINTINALGRAQVIYDGAFSGDEYKQRLQKCDIGLCTQNPQAMFNATSFPSKILSYLTNGLKIVSCEIDVLKNSKLNDMICYYKNDDLEEIADAIKSVDLDTKQDAKKIISELNQNFIKDLMNLLQK